MARKIRPAIFAAKLTWLLSYKHSKNLTRTTSPKVNPTVVYFLKVSCACRTRWRTLRVPVDRLVQSGRTSLMISKWLGVPGSPSYVLINQPTCWRFSGLAISFNCQIYNNALQTPHRNSFLKLWDNSERKQSSAGRRKGRKQNSEHHPKRTSA